MAILRLTTWSVDEVEACSMSIMGHAFTFTVTVTYSNAYPLITKLEIMFDDVLEVGRVTRSPDSRVTALVHQTINVCIVWPPASWTFGGNKTLHRRRF